MHKKVLADLIYRLKSGNATQEEIDRLEAFWRKSHNVNAALDDHTPEELVRIEQQMYSAIESSIRDTSPPLRRLWTGTHIYRAAAVLLVLVSVSLWFYANRNEMTEIRTDFGQRLAVSLPDKSSVVLNGNSTLRYSPQWSDDSPREIWIEGEGFFSVVHQQNDQKFIVHADKLDVEVLGTKFNVRTRSCVSEVMLTEGKVKLALPQQEDAGPMFLKPGEVATMNNLGLTKRTVRREQFTSWLDNKLYFERTPLREVAQKLKDTYGLEVRFSDPELGNRELSGEISSATEADILYAITATFNLQFVRDGRTVIISEKEK